MTSYELLSQPWLLLPLAAILGLVIGSFLNAVIYRLPIMMTNELAADAAFLNETEPAPKVRFNLSEPRSHCPSCSATVQWFDNIPLLSYLLLKRRCRNCQVTIAWRYPLIECLMAISTVIIFWQFGLGWPAALLCALTAFLLALAAIDIDTFLLPDKLTYPGLWLGLFASLFGFFTTTHDAIIGAIAGYGVLWSFFWLYRISTGKEGIGYGDFKLLAMLGAWFGWQALPALVILAAGSGALYGVIQMIRGQANRDTAIPFGPFIASAGWLWAIVFMHWGNPFGYLFAHWSL